MNETVSNETETMMCSGRYCRELIEAPKGDWLKSLGEIVTCPECGKKQKVVYEVRFSEDLT